MKLGYIDYLNCYPFYYHLFEKAPFAGIEVVPGYPADLNRMMASNELDMSPISAASCAQLDGCISLLPEFCLSSVGYVGSVVLRSKVPIEDLNGKTVGITQASHTSVILLKMLLKRYYGIEPVYRVTSPSPAFDALDAALLIGNEAMIGSREPVSYSYDLGELWLRRTGYPVVFAVFAVQKSALEKHRLQIQAAVDSYRQSLGCLNKERAQVIAGAQRRYPDIPYDIDAYYRVLQFEFTDELKQALQFYLHSAAELGMLTSVKQLRFWKEI